MDKEEFDRNIKRIIEDDKRVVITVGNTFVIADWLIPETRYDKKFKNQIKDFFSMAVHRDPNEMDYGFYLHGQLIGFVNCLDVSQVTSEE